MLLQDVWEGADMSFHDEFVLAAIIGAVAGLFFAAISREKPRRGHWADEDEEDEYDDDWGTW